MACQNFEPGSMTSPLARNGVAMFLTHCNKISQLHSDLLYGARDLDYFVMDCSIQRRKLSHAFLILMSITTMANPTGQLG